MATTADIKNGMCIELNGKTFSVVEFLHVKPGKGPAFVRTKLKNLENGRILDKTFSAGERSRSASNAVPTSISTRTIWAATSCIPRRSSRYTSTAT